MMMTATMKIREYLIAARERYLSALPARGETAGPLANVFARFF